MRDDGPAEAIPTPAPADGRAPTPPREVERAAQGVAPATATGLAPPAEPRRDPPARSSVARAFDALPGPGLQARVRALHDNNEAWVATWHVLGSARRRVDVSYFILDRDVFGHAFLGQLLRHRRSGIPVNVLVDASGDSFGRTGFTSTLRGQDYLQELVSAGASASVYNPYYRKVPRAIAERDLSLAAANHDKILATERYAITGGRNIGHQYYSSRRDVDMPFRDSDVVVDGAEAATELRRAVTVEMQRDDLNYRITPDMFVNVLSREAELLGAAAMMDHWLNRPPLAQAVRSRLRGEPAAREHYAAELMHAARADLRRRGVAPGEVALVNLHERALELAANPDLAGGNRGFAIDTNMEDAQVKALDRTSNAAAPHAFDQIEPGIERLLESARDRVILTNPYIVLSERVRRALESAGRRGVRITLLTDSPTTADNPLYSAFFMREWPRLMARVPNLRVFVLNGDQRMHAKTMVVDGEVGLIGSSNMDLLSAEVNGEIMEAIHSPAAARRLEQEFERDRKDPRNAVLEYTIQRDRRGRPVMRDGRPIVTFGPEHHVAGGRLRSAETLWKPLSRWIESWPQAQSLRWPDGGN